MKRARIAASETAIDRGRHVGVTLSPVAMYMYRLQTPTDFQQQTLSKQPYVNYSISDDNLSAGAELVKNIST
jgi:hypothetical protein